MIYDITFILFHFLLFLFNYRIMGKVMLHPSVLFSLLWFVVMLLHLVARFTLLPGLFELSPSTQLVYATGVFVFTLGSVLQTSFAQYFKRNGQACKQGSTIGFPLRVGLTIIVLGGLPFFVQASYQLFLASQIDDFFTGLRQQISYGDIDIGPVKYLVSFSFLVFGINLYEYFKNRTVQNGLLLLTCTLATLTYSVLSTGRTFYVIILLLFVGINFIQSKKISLAKYALLFIMFLMVFSIIGVVLGKGGDIQSSASDNARESASTTTIYFVSALSAYEIEQRDISLPNNTGDNTLRFFQIIGQKLGVGENQKLSELVQPFVFIPYSTNVYTFYSPYSRDFGKGYAFLMLFLFSILSTWLFTNAYYSGTLRWTIYYSFSLYPLALSIFQDQYLTLFSTWVQIVFMLEIILFFARFFKSVNFRTW